MNGNEALAEAAILAGCKHFFGYPITPQNEVNAYMSRKIEGIGGTYLQAESEVSAMNMVLGAAAAGVRALTSSSSPGISLKTEAISYCAASDLPCVIINIQRGGPGLGGIQPSQADYFQATKAPGHGDMRILVFAPSTVQEMVDTMFVSFDLSEKYRIPAMILADGLLGQMMEPVEFPAAKAVPHDKPWATCGHGGKRSQNLISSLYLEPLGLEKAIRERFARYDEIAEKHTACEEYKADDAEILIVAYGASSRVARSAVNMAREQGIKAGLLRPITVWPFPNKQIQARLDTAKALLTVEMSMGQMVDDVRLAVNGKRPVHFYGRPGGVVPAPEEILGQIKELNGGAK
jgi:2-oxoglutarate ferredoxin oxidoreductase subunit alpha